MGEPPEELIQSWQTELESDLASVTVFEDVLPTLTGLLERNVSVAICSNAAQPYADPLRRLLKSYVEHEIWSFTSGCIKPDPSIYADCLTALALPPHQVLFVGDTLAADVEGPRRAGLSARLVDRTNLTVKDERISYLTELIE